jgi:hypothetical protein
MTDRTTPTAPHLTPQQSTLPQILDTQILKLETQIADLNTQNQCLEQARSYILSSTTVFSTQRPSSYLTPRSSLRQQAIVRSALGRDNALSPPGAAGLLAEEDFEAAFSGEGDVVASVEDVRVTDKGGTDGAGEAASPSSTTSPPATGKRAKKGRRQENAAKAREGRMRKLEGRKK